MKNILPILLFTLCTACAQAHRKPIATLEFSNIEHQRGTDIYNLHFTSDVDLLNLFQASESPMGSGSLRCALTDDTNFSIEHVLQRSGHGPVAVDKSPTTQGRYSFVSAMYFTEALDDGRSDRTLSAPELAALLTEKQTIPCKYLLAAYNFKTYYSKPLLIPTTDILRENAKRNGSSNATID